LFGDAVNACVVRLLRVRAGLSGDDDDASDLVGVSTQAASDLSRESFQTESGLFGEIISEPRLLSEPSAYLGLLFRVLALRRTFAGVDNGFLSPVGGLLFFGGVCLSF
jgi:hypothetical protein